MKIPIRKVFCCLLPVFLLVVSSACIASGPTARVRYNKLVTIPQGKRIAVITSDMGGEALKDRGYMYVLAGKLVDSVGATYSLLLERELLESGVYRIIERKQLKQVLDEQKFAKTDLIDAETACEIGRIAGVDGVVLVQYLTEFTWFLLYAQKFGVGVAKMIEVATGEVVWSAEVRGTKHSLLPFIPLFSVSQSDMAIAMGEEIAKKLQVDSLSTGNF